ncbi:MAG: hypothetical protein M1825_005045 [Sarcosagium campestre]|nr:MAG: hypothetical protein M1825_005045 [Sarcosagium campestre]
MADSTPVQWKAADSEAWSTPRDFSNDRGSGSDRSFSVDWASGDHVMPDYARSATTASSRNVTGQSYYLRQEVTVDPEIQRQCQMLLMQLDGKQRAEKGDNNQTDSVGLQAINGVSAAHENDLTTVAEEASVRTSSDVNMKFPTTEEVAVNKGHPKPPQLYGAPATVIKGRKEGKRKNDAQGDHTGSNRGVSEARRVSSRRENTGPIRPPSGAPKRKRVTSGGAKKKSMGADPAVVEGESKNQAALMNTTRIASQKKQTADGSSAGPGEKRSPLHSISNAA